jgi:signal transduction histidine kinase
LERIFFHDLLNTLGALSGYVQLLDGSRGPEVEEVSGAILRLTETMAEQINEQRDLAAAENNDLAVRPTTINAREMLELVAVQYRNHAASRGRTISIGQPAEPVNIRTDKRLLQRIIANMLKNALEATPAGGEVTLRCRPAGEGVIFEVHNSGVIPRDVQLQIFQRAFSTKGSGRGLGTYSMKLLGERYLQGKVSFKSTPEEGTTFTAEFPKATAPAAIPT